MNEGTNLAGVAAGIAAGVESGADEVRETTAQIVTDATAAAAAEHVAVLPGPDDAPSVDPSERTFDRLPEFDERSRNFPIGLHLLVHYGAEAAALVPRSYTWSAGEVLDQGREGACVGFGWSGELLARPSVVAGVTNDFPGSGAKS